MQLIQFSLSSYYQKSHAALAKSQIEDEDSENTQRVASEDGLAETSLNLHVDQNCLHSHSHVEVEKGEGEEGPAHNHTHGMWQTKNCDKKHAAKVTKRTTVLLLESGIGASLS
jgi:hypothetical protein